MNAAAGREQSGARRPPGQKRAVFEQGKIAQHFARRKLSKNEKIEILQKRERSWQNGSKEKSIGIFSGWL